MPWGLACYFFFFHQHQIPIIIAIHTTGTITAGATIAAKSVSSLLALITTGGYLLSSSPSSGGTGPNPKVNAVRWVQQQVT